MCGTREVQQLTRIRVSTPRGLGLGHTPEYFVDGTKMQHIHNTAFEVNEKKKADASM